MWERDGEEPAPRGAALLAAGHRLAAVIAPHLLRFVAARRPQLRIAWGSREYHLRRDGIQTLRRDAPGFEDNPRTNYNDRLKKRHERRSASPAPAVGAQDDPPTPATGVVTHPPETQASRPTLDLSAAALQRAVDATMGRGPGEPGAQMSPDEIKAQISRLRGALTALDAVKDWASVEILDDELYQLHKAVEYTMRNHKASEAKSKLESLFK